MSVRTKPDAPPRKWWIQRMDAGDRETALLLAELERLLGSKESKADRVAIRAFLANYAKVTRGGNPAGIGLGSREVKNAVAIFARIEGAGALNWLPVLVLPQSQRIDRIMREVGRKPMHEYDRPKRAESARKVVIPKVDIALARGRRG